MSWVTFNVVVGGSNNADGQCQFTWTLDKSVPTQLTLKKGAVLQFSRDSSPNPPPLATQVTIFTTPYDYTILNPAVIFDLPNVTGITVHIPKVAGKGGDFDSLTNIAFNSSTNVLTGTFRKSSIEDTDDSCDWSASVTTPMPVEAKKATY